MGFNLHPYPSLGSSSLPRKSVILPGASTCPSEETRTRTLASWPRITFQKSAVSPPQTLHIVPSRSKSATRREGLGCSPWWPTTKSPMDSITARRIQQSLNFGRKRLWGRRRLSAGLNIRSTMPPRIQLYLADTAADTVVSMRAHPSGLDSS